MPAAKGSRSLRNAETRRKKAAHKVPRKKVTRIQGNTAGVRKRLKKQAGLNRAAAKAAAE